MSACVRSLASLLRWMTWQANGHYTSFSPPPPACFVGKVGRCVCGPASSSRPYSSSSCSLYASAAASPPSSPSGLLPRKTDDSFRELFAFFFFLRSVATTAGFLLPPFSASPELPSFSSSPGAPTALSKARAVVSAAKGRKGRYSRLGQ